MNSLAIAQELISQTLGLAILLGLSIIVIIPLT